MATFKTEPMMKIPPRVFFHDSKISKEKERVFVSLENNVNDIPTKKTTPIYKWSPQEYKNVIARPTIKGALRQYV
jgi:hypothetical protein